MIAARLMRPKNRATKYLVWGLCRSAVVNSLVTVRRCGGSSQEGLATAKDPEGGRESLAMFHAKSLVPNKAGYVLSFMTACLALIADAHAGTITTFTNRTNFLTAANAFGAVDTHNVNNQTVGQPSGTWLNGD